MCWVRCAFLEGEVLQRVVMYTVSDNTDVYCYAHAEMHISWETKSLHPKWWIQECLCRMRMSLGCSCTLRRVCWTNFTTSCCIMFLCCSHNRRKTTDCSCGWFHTSQKPPLWDLDSKTFGLIENKLCWHVLDTSELQQKSDGFTQKACLVNRDWHRDERKAKWQLRKTLFTRAM